MKYTLESALLELQQAEITLTALYDVSFEAARVGLLTEEHRRVIHAYRDYIHRTEKALYGFVTNVLRAGASVVGGALVESVLKEIPEPKTWPDAPPPTAGMAPDQAAEAASTPPALPGREGLRGGLGAAPVVVWAGVVLGAVVVAGAVYALIKGAEVAKDIITDVVKARENTKRYAKELSEQKRRYQKCVDSGKRPEHCAGLFPTPEAPQEETSSEGGPKWWLIALSAVGAVAVVAGGVWVYDRYFTGDDFGFEAARNKSRPKPLSPGEINSALGGYQLEVE